MLNISLISKNIGQKSNLKRAPTNCSQILPSLAVALPVDHPLPLY